MARTRASLALAIPRRSAPAARARVAPRHPRAFGRARTFDPVAAPAPPKVSGELRQLVNTFFGGLVFVAVLIA